MALKNYQSPVLSCPGKPKTWKLAPGVKLKQHKKLKKKKAASLFFLEKTGPTNGPPPPGG